MSAAEPHDTPGEIVGYIAGRPDPDSRTGWQIVANRGVMCRDDADSIRASCDTTHTHGVETLAVCRLAEPKPEVDGFRKGTDAATVDIEPDGDPSLMIAIHAIEHIADRDPSSALTDVLYSLREAREEQQAQRRQVRAEAEAS